MEKAGQHEHVIGIPVNNRAFGIEEPDFPSNGAAKNATARGAGGRRRGTAGDRVAQGLKEHGKFFDLRSNQKNMHGCSQLLCVSRDWTERALSLGRLLQ